MGYPVHLEPRLTPAPAVSYRWDAETEILSVRLTHPPGTATGAAHVVELTGTDGSWLLLDLSEGAIDGLEIAVWPSEVTTCTLRLPTEVEQVRARVAVRLAAGGPLPERTVPLTVERDRQGRHLRLGVGPPREGRTVQLAQSLLLDVDPLDEIAGIWLLDLPPLPHRHPLA